MISRFPVMSAINIIMIVNQVQNPYVFLYNIKMHLKKHTHLNLILR